jgi:thiamine biosynthesis lipoprotein
MTITAGTVFGCELELSQPFDSDLAGLFERYDQTFSRFRSDSELTFVNRRACHPTRVSPLFADAVGIALDAAVETGGLVDPTIGRSLTTLGYDRDFDFIEQDHDGAIAEPGTGDAHPGHYRDIRFDRLERIIRLPEGVQLDLNGVAKALAIDHALSMIGEGFVSIGGDIAASRPLEVALPAGGAVRLHRGALATSSPLRRRWRRGGAEHHHLIDPHTGRSSTSRWSYVTVCGAHALAADIAAKAAFLLGDGGPAWLETRGLPGRFVARDGGVLHTGPWRGQLGHAACT